MHKDRFKGVGSLENDLYAGMSKDSFKFLTEARNIRYRYEDIFLISKPVSGFMIGVAGFFADSLIIQSG